MTVEATKKLIDAIRPIRAAATTATFATTHRSDELVLVPGILVALRLLLPALGVTRILLSKNEYYRPYHFGNALTCEFDPAGPRLRPRKGDAVILSPVSWDGSVVPRERIEHLAGRISATGAVLILDGSHLGALGFPTWPSKVAHLVTGDFGKWISSPDGPCGAIGWLATSREEVGAVFRTVFRGLLGALRTCTLKDRSARWLAAESVRALRQDLSTAPRFRRPGWHDANLDLARTLRREYGGTGDDDAAIVFVARPRAAALLNSRVGRELRRSGLTWEVPGGGVRVLARADVLLSTTRLRSRPVA